MKERRRGRGVRERIKESEYITIIKHKKVPSVSGEDYETIASLPRLDLNI